MSDRRLQIWTDGGARGNPGPAAAGVVITQESTPVYQAGVFLGHHLTNNQAEYQALQLGLDKAQELEAEAVTVHMDSQLVVEQINGRYKVKDAGLQERWAAARHCLQNFGEWEVVYVPRSQNSLADRLVNQALDQQRDLDGVK
jgi:ribonuclease HI